MKVYDLTGTGKIETEQLPTVLKLWVDEWKNPTTTQGHKNCDINNDDTCSIEDFSILLYYVER